MLSIFSLFPSLTNIKIARGIIKMYAKEHNWHEINWQTGNLGYGWIHYALIRILRPTRVLCVGSRYGYIPVICALACKDNRRGIVDFVDAGFNEDNANEPNHWGGVGTWKKINPIQYFGKFGLSKYIHLHIETTRSFNKTHARSRWGYIYLDGDHSYQGVKHDFTAFWPKLIPNGALVFHDIHVKRMNNLIFGVYILWNEIRKKYPNRTMELPGKYGIGILTKFKKSHYIDS